MHSNSLFLLSGGWIQGLQLFAALSILILLHEFGHYFFAKLFKTRVEKFYLFFDFLFPLANVLNFSLFKKKIGETVYGIGWFPLGGYVKIAGMVDESMDKEQMAGPPQPWEFRAKPAWQRLFIMLGGIIVNVLLAIIVYSFMFWIWGEERLPTAKAKYGISVDSVGHSLGLQDGDKIISVGGREVPDFSDIPAAFALDGAKSIEVERAGQQLSIPLPSGTLNKLQDSKQRLLLLRFPTVVKAVTPKTAADSMELQAGDSIISMNGAPVGFYDQFDSVKTSLKGRNVILQVLRNGGVGTLSGRVGNDGTLGFEPEQAFGRFFDTDTANYNFGQALVRGTEETGATLSNYWKGFKLLFTSKEVKLTKNLGGIVSFGQMFPQTFTLERFLGLLALVSVILAFMNLLPVPGLDGGYVLFLLIEMITRRKVPDRVLEIANTIGLVLLLGLMLLANGLDIARLFK